MACCAPDPAEQNKTGEMRFRLQATLSFSAPLSPEAKAKAAEVVAAAEGGILAKGAPPGMGAKAVLVSAEGQSAKVVIESGRHVRAHDALMRLRKELAGQLGNAHRIGVREVKVEAYSVTFSVDREPLKAVSVPFARSVEFDGLACTILLEDLDEKAMQRNYIDRMVQRVRDKVAAHHYQGKAEYWEKMWESGPKEPFWREDPTDAMVKLNWIKQGPTKGKWFWNPQAAKVMRTMERIAMDEVLLPLGFQEVVQSHHVPFEVWLKSGHMEGIANEAYYVCEPRTRDPVEWERFFDLVKITKEVPADELARMVSPPKAGICYAQCPSMYWSLTGATLPDDSLPLLIIDRAANSNRYESGGRHGIERVDEFHRLEPIYVGTKEQLVALRERLIERYKHVFNTILDLEWRMAWVTPFYMQQSGQVGVDDLGAKVKGTIDFEAYLPYRGDRETSEWLEFQNLSIVGDKFTTAFNIKAQTQEVWSGCSGIGLERWTAAFLAQKGLDPANWPAGFRERFGDMPKGVRVL